MNPSYYAIIPAPVLYSKALTNFQKILYANISALTNKDGFCFASNDYFADLFGTTIETISRAVSGIAKAGFVIVEIDKQAGNSRKIYLSDQLPLLTKKSIGIDKKINTPIDKKINNNSIVYNSINNTLSTNVDRERASIEFLQNEQFKVELKDKFPSIGVDIEIEKAADWLRAKGKRYKDYAAFMRNWCRRTEQARIKELKAQGKVYTQSTLDTTRPDNASPRNNMNLV